MNDNNRLPGTPAGMTYTQWYEAAVPTWEPWVLFQVCKKDFVK